MILQCYDILHMMLPARKKETSKASIMLDLQMHVEVCFQLCIEGADGAAHAEAECTREHNEVIFLLIG
jgi:hypothetical protein